MGLNANGTHCCVETSGGQRCPLSSVLCPAAMKSSASMDSSDNKKTRHKLKKFLTRRPTLQAVRDKGYIKGAGTAPRRRHPAASPSSDPPPVFASFRSGVRLQPVRPVSQGERHGARLREDVHRPCGEQL